MLPKSTYPSNNDSSNMAGGSDARISATDRLEELAHMLKTDGPVTLDDIKRKFGTTSINFASVLETEVYKGNNTSKFQGANPKERELIFNHVLDLLPEDATEKRELAKKLREPKLNEVVHYIVCTCGLNMKRLESGIMVRQKFNNQESKRHRRKFKYPVGIFVDPTLARRDHFKCPRGKDCGIRDKAVQKVLKENPKYGKAMKYLRMDGQTRWLCVSCDIQAYQKLSAI